jgi:hypothetical protein
MILAKEGAVCFLTQQYLSDWQGMLNQISFEKMANKKVWDVSIPNPFQAYASSAICRPYV